MRMIENLLRTWNAAFAIDNVVAFLMDNPQIDLVELYSLIKVGLIFNNRLAIIEGVKGRLIVKGSFVGGDGASIYRPSFLH